LIFLAALRPAGLIFAVRFESFFLVARLALVVRLAFVARFAGATFFVDSPETRLDFGDFFVAIDAV
jgi:hypothetical protein